MQAILPLSDTIKHARPERAPQDRFASYRPPVSHDLLRHGLLIADSVCLTLITAFVLQSMGYSADITPIGMALPYLILPVGLLLCLLLVGAYRTPHPAQSDRNLRRALLATALFTGLYMGALAVFDMKALSRFGPAFLVMWAGTGALHIGYALLIKRLSRAGRMSEKIVLVGATETAATFISRNQNHGLFQVLGVFDDRDSRAPDAIDGIPVLGGLDALLEWDRLPEVDKIIVTVTSEARTRVKDLIDRLRILPHRVILMLDLGGLTQDTARTAYIGPDPAAYVSGQPADRSHATLKRISDMVLGMGLLIGFAPIMLICALLIKLEDGGPIFFRQRRQGVNNQLIRVWKFRTMIPDPQAEIIMARQTMADDPRITRIGRFLRLTSLDELPQLFNVLKGNMSLVGPRPHALGMTAEAKTAHEIVSEYAHRHRTKPGLTGWAQINGSRGPIHTEREMQERIRLDLEYIERASLLFDLYIMLKTAPCLLGDRTATR